VDQYNAVQSFCLVSLHGIFFLEGNIGLAVFCETSDVHSHSSIDQHTADSEEVVVMLTYLSLSMIPTGGATSEAHDCAQF
jgi:hypothetical protein